MNSLGTFQISVQQDFILKLEVLPLSTIRKNPVLRHFPINQGYNSCYNSLWEDMSKQNHQVTG